MPWTATVNGISLKQLHRGPIRTVIVTVTALEIENEKNDKNYNDEKSDTVYSDTFSVDDKVKVFFKFILKELKYAQFLLIPYVSIQKTESEQNCKVEITCQEFRKVTTCSEEWIELQLCPIESWHGGFDNSINAYIKLFTIEVNITVHEMSIQPNLFKDTEFTDFQLKTADGAVAVHKAILAIHSDMFKTMLKGEWKETVEGCINIDGVSIETLQCLKDYMYLGTLPEEGLEPLILLAEHYFIDKLKTDCITKLVKSVKPENFDRIIKFACQSNSEELVSGLIFGIPDNVADSIYRLKNKETESTESNDEK